jgi:hypothetical protein
MLNSFYSKPTKVANAMKDLGRKKNGICQQMLPRSGYKNFSSHKRYIGW